MITSKVEQKQNYRNSHPKQKEKYVLFLLTTIKTLYITLNLEPKPIDKTTKLENIKKSLANISRSVEFDKGFDKFIVSYLTGKEKR